MTIRRHPDQSLSSFSTHASLAGSAQARARPRKRSGSGSLRWGYGGSLAPPYFRKLPPHFRSYFRNHQPGHLTTLKPFALVLELKVSDRSI